MGFNICGNTKFTITQNRSMKIIKISRGGVDVEVNGYVFNIWGEAMLPQQLPALSDYILYSNTLDAENKHLHPVLDKEALFNFLEKEFLQRSLRLIIE